MAEQRIDVHDIHANSVTVSPVQVVSGMTAPAVRGWTEALLQGPLEHAQVIERATTADALREAGDHAGSAQEFLVVAEALADAGYDPAADTYLARAAAAQADAGERAAARSLFLRLARGSLDDGSLEAQGHARRAHELSEPTEAWEAHALRALASWPERLPGDIDALRAAWEKTRGSANELEWASALVELLILTGEPDHALAVARNARDERPFAPGDRLALELDFLDLVDEDEADAAWSKLTQWLADPALPVPAAATAWQRRGVALARREDPEQARVAFLHAVQQWSRERGFDDQAGEAYFSALSARAALGDMTFLTDDARRLAGALRGDRDTATSHTERLLRRGLAALVNNKLPDAFRLLSLALNTARRAGNLSDFFQAAEALGDCLVATEKHAGLALAAYVQAGLSAKTKPLTESSSVDDVLSVVSLDGPRWERGAAWAAVAGAGRTMSDDAAATIAERALAEHEHEPAGGFLANAAYYALEALASAVCAVPAGLRGRCLDVLRHRLSAGLGDPNRLAAPFLEVTLARQADETGTLVDTLLTEHAPVNLRGSQLAELLAERPDQRLRLVAAARNGHAGALEALAFADLLNADPALVERARARVEQAARAPIREVREENGTRTVSYGIGSSLAPEGLYARACPVETREALLDKLLEIVADVDVPLMTRVGAVEALHNLAPALPDERVEAVAGALSHLAMTDDVPAEMDRLGDDEPLARFKWNMAPPYASRSAAVEALGLLVTYHPGYEGLLAAVLPPALGSALEPLVVAALHVLGHNPTLAPSGLDVRLLVGAPWAAARVAALATLLAADPPAAASMAHTLLSDPSEYVRRQLVYVGARLADQGRDLLLALAADSDAFVRATARRALDEPA